MNKEAIAAKTLLKSIAAGTSIAGLTGGAGYLGHKFGYKRGATRATNEMATAFSEANARENKQITDSFKLFNKKENAAIASNYMRRGMALGAELHATGKIKTPAEMASMAKTSSAEDIYNAAFEAELDKHAFLGSALKKGVKTIKGLYRKSKPKLKSAGSYVKKHKKPLSIGAAGGAAAGYSLS